MPRPNRRMNDKPKDLKGSLVRIFKSLGDLRKYMFIAVVLAALGSILSIIGPNKISDLTDTISNGIMIDSKALKELSSNIEGNLKDNTPNISKEVLTPDLTSSTISSIMSDTTIPAEDKASLTALQTGNTDISTIINLPNSIKNVLYNDKEINGVKVSKEDRLKFLELSSSVNSNSDRKTLIKTVNSYPESIKKLIFEDYEYKGVKISSNDKIKFLSVMSGVKYFNDGTAIYKTLDKLPKSIKNVIKPKMNMKKVKSLSLFLLILYIISAVFNYLQSILMAIVSNTYTMRLRDKMSDKINHLPLRYFDRVSVGEILSRTTNDIDTIGQAMYQSMSQLVGAVTLFIASIIMMFVTNKEMALAAIISSLIGFVLMFIITFKSQKYFNKRQKELGKLNSDIEQAYSLHNIIKAYNGEKIEEEKFNKLNESVYDANRKSQFLAGLMPPIMSFIGNFSYVAVCVVGAYLTMKGNISFGVIVAFMIYARLFTSPLSQIAQGATSIQQIAASSERVFEVFDAKDMDKEKEIKYLDPKDAKGNIEFKNVKFSYDASRVIIKDFSAKIKAGSKVAIVGPTGAGKTTVVNLLMKFYNIDSGDIIIDGNSIKDLTRENIHDLFTMVLQDTWLFEDTIRNNVKYNGKATDEEIWKALEAVEVDHYVKTLPGGLDYILKDNGEISIGQKQLLTIARGMLKNAPFLILDEATSSVDTRTEEQVQKAMDKLMEGKTSFIIAHRLSTIKNSDLILVMKDGDIIEKGTHESLLKKKGFYAELYNSQFKK